MKMYIVEINKCIQCPACRSDHNEIRFRCAKTNYKFIMNISLDSDEKPIPDWCPLDDQLEEVGL